MYLCDLWFLPSWQPASSGPKNHYDGRPWKATRSIHVPRHIPLIIENVHLSFFGLLLDTHHAAAVHHHRKALLPLLTRHVPGKSVTLSHIVYVYSCKCVHSTSRLKAENWKGKIILLALTRPSSMMMMIVLQLKWGQFRLKRSDRRGGHLVSEGSEEKKFPSLLEILLKTFPIVANIGKVQLSRPLWSLLLNF